MILQRFLYETCNCADFEVLVNCNDTGGSYTVYSVQLNGPMADDLLNLWLMIKRKNDNKIELLGVTAFTLCNQTCSGAVTEVMSENSGSALQLIIILITIAIIILIVLIVCAIFCYYK